jgi:hypothetical protein
MHVQNTVLTKRVALCHQTFKKREDILGYFSDDNSLALVSFCSRINRSCTGFKSSFKVWLKGNMSHTPVKASFKVGLKGGMSHTLL